MKKPAWETVEKHHDLSNELMLLVDKEGVIGTEIIRAMQEENTEANLVFVSKKACIDTKTEKGSILSIPYAATLPMLPNGDYAYIIIVLYFEKELQEALPLFVKKAQESRAKCIIVLPVTDYDKNLIEEILNGYTEAVVVCIGDIFTKDVSTPLLSPMQLLLKKAWYKGDIELSGMGLAKLHPVLLEDATPKILEVIFGATQTTRMFYVLQKHAPTLLSVARIIQKVEPTVRIDFIEKDTNSEHPRFIEGKYMVSDSYPLQERVKEVFAYMASKKDDKEETPLMFPTKTSHGMRHSFFWIGIFMVWLLLLPLLVLGVFGFFGTTQVSRAIGAIEKGEFVKAEDASSLALSSLAIANRSMQMVRMEASYMGMQKQGEDVEKKITRALVTTTALHTFANASSHALAVLTSTKGTENEFAEARQGLYQTLVLLQQIDAEYPALRKRIHMFPTHNIASTWSTFPDVLGFEGKRAYLVLFQNNMEIRPGGGFIGSYGLLSLDKGKVGEFSIHDVYDADGQLKGHVEPPYPIRRYLPSEHWYLRDSNFNVDFPKSASSAAYFLNLETQKTVDGVIAVDVSFLQSVVKALGPVYVADYQETVTADNVFALTQKHAEKDFFPGSTQKKDFLGALFRSLQQQLRVKKEVSYVQLLQTLEDAVMQKHLLFAFSNTSVEQLFRLQHMSSSLEDSRKEAETTINDFVGISEANLGVNKVNYAIARKVEYAALVPGEAGGVIGKLTIRYANTSPGRKFPGGDYKNYVRIIVPLQTKLNAITIDGQKQDIAPAVTNPLVYERKNFSPPKGLEVEQTTETNKTVFGTLLIIPPGMTKTITFTYTFPVTLPKDSVKATYNLIVFKQPGTETYPFSVSLTYPHAYTIVSVPKGVTQQEGSLQYTLNLEKDETIEVELAKE